MEQQHIKLVSDSSGIRLDTWISEKVDEISRTYAHKLIDTDMVLVNGITQKAKYKVAKDDVIEIILPSSQALEVEAQDIDIDIIYEDNDILIINKPKEMVVHPAAGNYNGTLVNALMFHCKDRLSDINGIERPGIVHRIDKDTTGLLVVAKNNKAHKVLSEMLKRHDIRRIYSALVLGIVNENNAVIDMPIGRHPVDRKKMAVVKTGRNALTKLSVIERYRNATYVELELDTGRTHQIRVHMSHIGHPVIGDVTYGRKHENNKYEIPGQALHARVLKFEHPITGQFMKFESPLPDYFVELIDKLKAE